MESGDKEHRIWIGTAGWSIPKTTASQFPGDGTHLERYARQLSAVEINSSFYQLHQPKTYARWRQSTPAGFRFAVKAPRQITHIQRLRDTSGLEEFLAGVRELGEGLGPILIQLPPSLVFHFATVQAFYLRLREVYSGQLVCEPRHRSWFTPEAAQVLKDFQVARVAADPAIVAGAAQPGGWEGLVYYRLHGSPQMYASSYSPMWLASLANKIIQSAIQVETWCIFDNTAEGAAYPNAFYLIEQISSFKQSL